MTSLCSSESSLNKVDRTLVLAAVDRRVAQRPTPTSPPRISTAYEFEDFHDNHPLRVEFRRLINPGITRNNSRPLALDALQLLCEIADNILKYPEQDRYLKVNATKKRMKNYMMEPKGTVEVLLKLGFREKVIDATPYFVFNKKHLETLRVGAHCLKEALNAETNKQETAERAQRQQQVNEKAAKTKVNKAFYDDRRRKKEADDRERAVRAAAALNRQDPVPSEKTTDVVVRRPSEPASC